MFRAPLSTVDVVYQFIPVLKTNGYRLVTVGELLEGRGARKHGGQGKTVAVNELRDSGQRSFRLPHRPNRCPSRSPILRVRIRAGQITVPQDLLLLQRLNDPLDGGAGCFEIALEER